MKTHKRILVIAVVALATSQIVAQTKQPLEIADMFKIKRVSSPALSPDGEWIVYTITMPDLGTNKNASDLWIISINGGTARQLTTDPANDRDASWSPDGNWIAFESTRSGDSQIWIISPNGGEARQLTNISTEAKKPTWSPDGKTIAFLSEVFPEYSDKPFTESDALNKKKLSELKNGKVKGKIFTSLLYRHWDSWVDGRRKHIFVQPVLNSEQAGNPRDLTPGNRDAVPTSTTFSAGIDYAFSSDGKEIAYTATPVPVQEESWSTNHDIYTVPVQGGTPKQLTTNPAADGYPRYSRDGKYITYRAQSVPGFESDRWQLMLYDRSTGKIRDLTENFDAVVESPVWSPDSKRLYFEAQEQGNVPIFTVSTAGNDVKKVLGTNTNHDLDVTSDGKTLVFSHRSAARPAEIYTADIDGKGLKQITQENDKLFSTLDIPQPESIRYQGDGGKEIQAWIFKPPKMVSGRKYPLVFLVHGGPQGAWLNSWSYRWNPALWSAQGYVVMAPNPRGSTGFGQQFTNEISRDWGGKVFLDLMKGLDYAETLPYVDATNKAAAGASYGGYMMNWFQGHAGERFKTLVTHCGVYNSESMYGTTEELWFEEWDHGETPWANPEGYTKFSPHKYAKNFKTPNLIIHNQLDYRVPFSEGMQLFTALQRKGIPSKMLYFPDEGHWVNKPANSNLWHKTVFEWLTQYLKAETSVQ
jgi:dipeptidyl aminopeptidase/acylaminoacyl peptidase